jgi:hypothetical protein
MFLHFLQFTALLHTVGSRLDYSVVICPVEESTPRQRITWRRAWRDSISFFVLRCLYNPSLRKRALTLLSWTLISITNDKCRPNDDSRLTDSSLTSLILRLMVSRQLSLGKKHAFGAYDQIFITVRQLRVCWCGALSDERMGLSQLLLSLARTVIFGSESHGTRDHILLSKIRDLYFRCLLRLAGLRWKYSTRRTD